VLGGSGERRGGYENKSVYCLRGCFSVLWHC